MQPAATRLVIRYKSIPNSVYHEPRNLNHLLFLKCDWACENRACGLKYTTSFDEAYLNTEMMYLDSVSSVVKPNKLLTNCKIFVTLPCDNLDNAIYRDPYRVIVIKIINFLLSIIQDNSKFPQTNTGC